jgi:hypothetical protein
MIGNVNADRISRRHMVTKRFKEIFRDSIAFGRRVYRGISNGTQVRCRTMPLGKFEPSTKTIEFENPYRTNQAYIDLFVHAA